MQVEVTALIDRPIREVWEFCAVDHARNHPRWDPDIRLEQVTDGPIGPGTVFKRWNTRYEQPTEGSMEVIEFRPEELMTTRIQDGQITTIGRFAVSPAGPERTTLTIGGEFPGMPEEMAEKIRPMMQRSVETIQQLLASE